MKSVIYTVLTLLMVVVIAGCKDDDNVVNPPVFEGQGYFPAGNGTYYKYNTMESSPAGETNGTRSTTYSGTQGSYQIQIDTSVTESGIFVSTSLFRKTNDGVFYFVDTAGLSLNIPDSLHQYLTIDQELRAIKFEFTNGSNWPVFLMQLNYGPITFAPVDVTAYYSGREPVTLNLTTGERTETAVKLRYVLTLKRDISGAASTFEAFCWLVEDIGIVKWEGNATVLNGISGGGIDFDDTTKVVTQNLIQFDVK
jgi:hypothetical protein